MKRDLEPVRDPGPDFSVAEMIHWLGPLAASLGVRPESIRSLHLDTNHLEVEIGGPRPRQIYVCGISRE
jgi:hypothetical protein